MYNKNKAAKSTIVVNESQEGETIEMKIERITVNKEPIKDGAPITYTERREGVKPEFNIKTDRFEMAIEAADKIKKTTTARRKKIMEEYNEKQKKATESNEKNEQSADSSGTSEPTNK